jgi:BirA family biotin operon repressor/biotin-[acetyl-CoA-carboxylase] ligase
LNEDTVLITDYQAHGKGQGQNTWHSENGMNILLSWFIRPAFLSASHQFLISKFVSLALIDHLERYLGNIYIKWPNDILVGTRKIAGILIAHSLMMDRITHSIIGIGLNVNQDVFPSFPVTPTSLYLETGRQVDLEKQLRQVMKALYKRYEQLRNGDKKGIDEAYLEHLFRYRKPSLFAFGDNVFEGSIRGVNEYGQLLVEVSGETRIYNFQEIQLLFS